ncbi:replication initiation protein [Bifidobacterium longum subsp. longum]|nr:replication initiation protein [Bifidobacterium longum]MCD0186735.1 replication initiation protein [Bifidobacterium longum subsp. longum]
MSDEIVKYSNQFNNQALRKFTALDLDLLMAIASRVRDKGTDEVAFTFEELKRLAGLQRNMTNDEFAKQIANVNRRLLALNFEFQNEEHDIIQFALFAGFVTSPTKRTLTVSVNSRFSFLLNDLTSQFTRFELAEFTALRSSYAKECYRRLKQYRQTGVWKVSLEDFRRLLDVPKSYRPSEINKYVLKPIEEELGPLLNLKVHRKYLKKKPGRGRASLVGFEFEFDPEKVPGGAPAPRVELSGSVVTDEARKSLRAGCRLAAVSHRPDGQGREDDVRGDGMHRRCETDGDDRHQQIKIERGELAAERARAELDAYKAAHDGLTPFEVARRSHDSQAMPDDRMEPGIEPTLF